MELFIINICSYTFLDELKDVDVFDFKFSTNLVYIYKFFYCMGLTFAHSYYTYVIERPLLSVTNSEQNNNDINNYI